MPELTEYPAIDVAIGLAAMIILLSTVCSAIQELIASVLKLRAKDLVNGLKELLEDDRAADVMRRIPGDNPSYIDPRQFSLALVDTLAPEADRPGLLREARKTAEKIEAQSVGRPLVRMIDEAQGDVERFRAQVEEWFNAAMGRVSGGYRRRVQYILLVIATAVTIGFNADTFHVANELWSDPTLRAALVEKADQIQQAGEQPAENGAAQGGTASAEQCPSSQEQKDPARKCVEAKLDNVAKSVDAIEELKLPVGWQGENVPDEWAGWVAKVAGWLATIFALSLGAPFWFDTLGRLSTMRGSGRRPNGSTDRARA